MKHIKTLTLLLACTTGLASAAASGSISLEDRTDFIIESYDSLLVANHAKDSVANPKIGKDANFGFNFQRIRTTFAGKFSNDVGYKVRLRFDKLFAPATTVATTTTTTTALTTKGTATTAASTSTSATTVNATKIGGFTVMDPSGMLDNAYVQPNFTDELSVKFGKFSNDGVGYEEAVYNGADVYQFSTIDKYYLATSTGAKAYYKVGDVATINATVANSNVAMSNDRAAQSFLNYGLGFTSKISMFEPVGNWYFRPMTKYNAGIQEMGFGVRTTVDKFVAVVDLQAQLANGTAMNGTANEIDTKAIATFIPSTTKNDSALSNNVDKVIDLNIVLQYKGENFRPQVKFFNDWIYDGKNQSYKSLGGSAGLEYYPSKDAKFRYHLIATDVMTTPINLVKTKDATTGVTSITSKTDGTTINQMKLYAGVSANLEMFKF